MASKRMFDKAIIETDNFLDLPNSGKALYFLLGMEADDEGFASPKRVTRLYGFQDDDVKILITKKFLIPFQSGVVVITDWHKNNWLDNRRIKPTIYSEEKAQLSLDSENCYVLSDCLANAKPEEYRIEENRREESRVEPKKPKVSRTKSFEEIDMKLATLLRDKIKENMPTFKEPILSTWAHHVRLMRERDNRTPEQIEFLIKWSQKSNFWQSNILSTKKLRDKFDVLVGQAKREVTKIQSKKANIAF